MADNELIIKVGFDTTGFDKGRERVEQGASETENRINRMGRNSADSLNPLQAKALSLAGTLSRLGERSSLGVLAKDAQAAAARAGALQNEVRRIQEQLLVATEPKFITALNHEADIAKGKLAALQRETLALKQQAGTTPSSGSSLSGSALSGAAFGGGAGAALAAVQVVVAAVKEVISLSEQGVTALFDLSKGASDFGSKIFDASQKVSLSAQSLSTIKLAADISGSSLDDFTGGFIKFEKNLAEAAHGNEQLGKTFRALGIDVQAGVKEPEAAFSQFLATFSKLPPSADRAAVATTLYGKTGAQLIPTFLELGSSFEAAKEKAEKLGLTFDSNAAAAADRFGDTLDTVKKQVTGLGYTIGTEFEPVFTDVLSEFSKLLSENKDEIKEWATAGADFVTGLSTGISNFESITEGVLNNVNNRLRDYGTSISDIYNKLKAINSTLPLPLKNPIFDIIDNAEKLRGEGAADRPRREALARAKAAREQLENNKINFATGKVVGDDEPNLDFLGGDDKAKKAEAQARKAEEAAKRLAAGQRELETSYLDLTTKLHSDNPFVKVYDEAAKSMVKLRLETRGFSKETQELFDLQRQINAKNLAAAHNDNAFQALSLRQDAADIRAGGKGRNRFTADGKDYFFDPTNSIQGSFTTVRQGVDLSRLNRTIINDDPGKVQPNLDRQLNIIGDPVIALAARLRQDDPNKRATDRLQEQFDLAAKLQSQNSPLIGKDEALGLADKRIIGITSGLAPGSLTAPQADLAAAARDREAKRVEGREKEAGEFQKKMLSFFEKLDKLVDAKGLRVFDGDPNSSGKDVTLTIKQDGSVSTDVSGPAMTITPVNGPTPSPQPLGGTYRGNY